jgi:hypothetical protein
MLRKLKTTDMFKMSKILKKMNLKKEINVKDDEGKTKKQEQVGVELFISALENIHLAENEVMELMSDMAQVTKEELDNDPEKFFEIIKEFKSMPGVSNFLKQANQLTK